MSDYFIMVYDIFFKEQKLSPQQLFLYSYLYRNRMWFDDQWTVRTSVNDIITSIPCKIQGDRLNVKKRNIVLDILELKRLNAICSDMNENEEVNMNRIYSFGIISKDTDIFHFKQIPYKVFDKFNDKNSFWVYCFICYKDEWGLRISYKELSAKSGLSVSLLKDKIIHELENKNESPRIYKFSGSYISGSTRQEENRYYVDLFITDEKLDEYNRLHSYKENKKVKYNIRDDEFIWCPWSGEITLEDFKIGIEESNWGKADEHSSTGFESLSIADYCTYRTSVEYGIDEKFNKRCKKGIETMTQEYNQYKYDYDWETWESVYLECYNEKKTVNETGYKESKVQEYMSPFDVSDNPFDPF